MEYKILIADKDFRASIDPNSTIGGKDAKLDVFDDNGRAIGFFKRQNLERSCFDATSEKIAFELADKIGYRCAKNELALDVEGNKGVLIYYFSDKNNGIIHQDFGRTFGINRYNCKKSYTLSNIKQLLDRNSNLLYIQFISQLFFDAFIGMGDRHENNWGLLRDSRNPSEKRLSPFYDNSGSLLHNILDEKLRELKNNPEQFKNHALKSRSHIFGEDGHKLKHFEIINYLTKSYPEVLKCETEKLNKNLSKDDINQIVSKVPSSFASDLRKEMIIKYLIIRKEELCKICG